MPSARDLRAIDLNADLGEGPGEGPLYRWITSANVACGGHAGDDDSMRRAVELARAHGVAVGAHPGYPDRERFGRVSLRLAPGVLASEVARQVGRLARIAAAAGCAVVHVKPHGALYGDSAADDELAEAIARGSAALDPPPILVGRWGSRALEVWRGEGFPVAAEIFADRGYRDDGTLLPRGEAGALILDPAAAAAQAVRLASATTADTVCVHSDTPGAAAILRAVRTALEAAGIRVRPLAAEGGRT